MGDGLILFLPVVLVQYVKEHFCAIQTWRLAERAPVPGGDAMDNYRYFSDDAGRCLACRSREIMACGPCHVVGKP